MVIFQRLEKVLKEKKIKEKIRLLIVILFFVFNFLYAQIDSRFDTFDWEIYSNNESINSISEGYKYVYFATDSNGILRFNKFSTAFEGSLFFGQGIKSKKIKHVYFDNYTGILWSFGNKGVEYSNNRIDNWNLIKYQRLSLNSYDNIIDIGSSINYLWLKTFSGFIKLDHINGTYLGFFKFPDENNINWGDFNFKYQEDFNNLIFDDYFIENGWLVTQSGASDNTGTFYYFTTFLKSENGDGWLGLSDGSILKIDNFSRTIFSISNDMRISIPFTISIGNEVWIGGEGIGKISSISKIDKSFSKIINIKNSEYSNFAYNDFFSSKIIKEELWLGSNGSVIVYNHKKDFFRTLGFTNSMPSGKIQFLEILGGKVYIASTSELVVVDAKSKKKIRSYLSDLVNKNNLFIDDLKIFDNKIFMISNGRLYEFDSNEKLVANSDYKHFFDDKLLSYKIFKSGNDLFLVSNLGIIDHENTFLVSPSMYFNSIVNDMLVIDDMLYIGTNTGLLEYNIKNAQYSFYDYIFLKNIFQIRQIDEFLILISSSGLIKLRL